MDLVIIKNFREVYYMVCINSTRLPTLGIKGLLFDLLELSDEYD